MPWPMTQLTTEPASKPHLSDYEDLMRFFELFELSLASSSKSCRSVRFLRDTLQEHGCEWTKEKDHWPSDAKETL